MRCAVGTETSGGATGPSTLRCILRTLLAMLFLHVAAVCLPAQAHEMTMAELELRELSKGDFLWAWGQSGTQAPVESDLTPVWPAGCRTDEQSLHCAPPGLVGKLSVEGVGKKYSAAMVRIHWLDGQTRVYTITPAQTSVMLFGAADDRRSAMEIVVPYTVLGVEHILTGFDHLLFVFSLLFLVGFQRRLVGTVTAFTVAHSITLGLSVLGVLTLRSAPVEATIALSIVLVAAEALHHRDTLARRWPALVAFLFGLVHGLGFASALKDIGLPENHLPVALLTFNLGVEIGQLLVVGLAWALTRWLSRYRWFERARKPALYGIGMIAGYWSWLRIAAVLTWGAS